MWWTERAAVVNVPEGGTATWRLGSRTQQGTVGANTQRCSQHVIIAKSWDGSPTPPPELDEQAYELRLTMISNLLEPAVVNTGVSVCKYLEYATPSVNFAPLGNGFTTTPSPTLNCSYENDIAQYTTDEGGYWIPRGGEYEVTEVGVPAGWSAASGIGRFTVDAVDPDNYSRCTLYPAFGTSAAVLDSNGAAIPEFGRASAKWCQHLVTNTFASATTTTTTMPATTTTSPATTTTEAITTTTDGAVSPPSTLAPILPETGDSNTSITLSALALVLAGFGFVAVARRRSAT